MGGILVLGSLLVVLLFFADLSNRWLQIAVLLSGGFAAIGAFDDWVKLSTTRPGMTAKGKLFVQFVVSSLAFLLLETAAPGALTTLGVWIPGVHHVGPLALWSVPVAVVVVVGSANAVNLTDGLDGLASGCLAMAFGTMAVLSFIAGNSEWANFTGVPRGGNASEMAILSAAACGAVLGFLWFNRHPARVFMGNTGALPLGALLGLIAVAAQLQLVLVLIGIVFVAETLSVILQVASFKFTGKRIFRCAPLHHHFQFLGWSERRTVTRFWVAGAVAAICTLIGLGIGAISNTSEVIQLTAGNPKHDSAER
jgi:phospho-N-acetylmuramoyl-pentapeptide-transferase